MTFNASLVRSSIPSSKDPGRMWLTSEVHLAQQVQILQSEYPGRIQQEYVEEMKWDHFYGSLNPKYRCMLAHKVDSKYSTSYSNLLLAEQKLERWAEARDPLLLKTTTTGGSNVTWPQAVGNLFPSRKLNEQSYLHSLICHSGKHWKWRQTQMQGHRRGRIGWIFSLQRRRPRKLPLKLVEQISCLAISSNLPMQLSFTRR